MSVTYKNIKNHTYYLHSSFTKTGKKRYYFSTKRPQEPVNTIPEGYEIYENPNGQVFLRKILKSLITQEELADVNKSIEKYAAIEGIKTVLQKKHIVLYTPDQNIQQLKALFSTMISPNNSEKLQSLLNNTLTYSAVMRFELLDPNKRLFLPERFVYMGDGFWFIIDKPKTLIKLCKKFIKHIGRDSFFELGV